MAIVDELSADLEYPSSTPTMASSPRPPQRRGPPRPRGWLVRGSRRPWRLSVAGRWLWGRFGTNTQGSKDTIIVDLTSL